MIVCHCNVLTDAQIRATFEVDAVAMPRSPVQVQKCLGCAPECGRCLVTIREMLADARIACSVGCATCPGNAEARPAHDEARSDAFLIAAA